MIFARYAGSQIGHGAPLVKPLESSDLTTRASSPSPSAMAAGASRRLTPSTMSPAIPSITTARSVTGKATSHFMPSKTFAGTGAFGPWMVTADEIPDPSTLKLVTRPNGQVVQDTTTDLLITSVQRLIAYCSTILLLEPGDVIVGHARRRRCEAHAPALDAPGRRLRGRDLRDRHFVEPGRRRGGAHRQCAGRCDRRGLIAVGTRPVSWHPLPMARRVRERAGADPRHRDPALRERRR